MNHTLIKRIFAVGLLVLLFSFVWVSAACCQALPKNALEAHGSFERDSHAAGVADSWSVKVSGNVTATSWVDFTTYKEGRASQRLELLGSTGSGYIRLFRSIQVGPGTQLQPGDNVSIRADIKTSSELNNSAVRCVAYVYAATWATLKVAPLNTTAETPVSDWTTAECSFTLPQGAAWVSLYFYLESTKAGASGSLWVDDVFVGNGQTYTPVAKPRWLQVFGRPLPEMTDLYTIAKSMDGLFIPEFRHNDVPTLRMYNPWMKLLLYEVVGLTDSKYPNHPEPNDPVGYGYIQTSHPEWFLRDSSGKIMFNSWYPDLALVDFGNVEYQNLWAERAIKKAKSEGFDGIFLDVVVPFISWSTDGKPAKYPDDAKWGAAMDSFVRNVIPKIRAAGLEAVANFGHSNWKADPWSSWTNILSGGYEEHCFYRLRNWQKGAYVGESTWLNQVNSMSGSGNKAYIAEIQSVVEDTQKRQFAIGSYLLGKGPNTYIGFRETYKSVVPYHQDFEINLGQPVESCRKITGLLYSRQYTGGMVYVNPSSKTYCRVRVPQDYRSIEGKLIRKGSLLTIAPQTAQILFTPSAYVAR